MKFSTKIIGTMLALFICSCSKEFLDKKNPTQLGEETFYNTEVQVNQAVIGIYSQLQDIIADQWLFQEFITDNTTVHFNEGNRGNGPNIESIEYWQYNSNTGKIYDVYRRIYNALGNINTVLSKLSETEIEASAKSRFEGEARFFRAYYYFLLSQYFGDAIIVEESIQDPSEAFEYSRSPISEIYALIENDLAFSISSLPKEISASEAGRLSKGAALTLQAKVSLTQKDYVKAKTVLEEVIDLGIYSLLPNYADIFDPNNKNHRESIFEVQFQGDNDLGESSGFIYNFYPLFSQGAVTGFSGVDGNGWNIPTLDLINSYEEGDLRKDVSLSEGYTNNEGTFVDVPFIKKFHHTHSVQGRPDDNWPVFRYADVLLMLAEAINETSGSTNESLGYLNQVRERAGLDPVSGLSQDQLKDAIRHERRIELAFENHRWFDLKRTFTPSELVTFLNAHGENERANPTTSRGQIGFSPGDYKFEAHEILFPLPERELLVNPNLKQNEGY
ncbi:RagB/SusD family nutrient uptake outer membrane protein [Zobellia amurskyensis]|uniref:RagB/SusD family nutrient uptake outer membrane protein n=1 Tax=Zobellia amurskyensis TaxID=248905 RepID=A0A7X2ZV49_9FLAO|nr:RagB/SusD family nutrient uptake outer membrane protein [Zobellia amurskyensis]MUH36985.1 RagB/SusD family nutrient uptake outer membrane protein [Zobellia amurskyensis]